MVRLVLRRFSGDRMLLLSVFIGVTVATTLVAGAPPYIRALERQSLNTAIDGLVRPFSNITVFGLHVPLTHERIDATEEELGVAIAEHLGPVYEGRERYLLANTRLAGLPRNPLPEEIGPNDKASRAYFRSFSNLEHHVRFVSGRMAEDTVSPAAEGVAMEAVIGTAASRMFGLTVGTEIPLVTSVSNPTAITAKIVGIVEALDPNEDYWQLGPGLFLDPPPPEEPPEGVELDYDPGEPPVPLFATRTALIDGVGGTYASTLVTSLWFIFTEKEELKRWSLGELRERLDGLERDVAASMPGSDIATRLDDILLQLERRSFFSKVPLLLLLTVMVATVLFYLAMTVAYLVQKREGDLALLKTRGVGTIHMLRLYGLEATLITLVAVIIAPFLAMGAVALAGKLPYFAESTGGSTLPVQLSPDPFLAALGAGALCLAILIVPPLLGARGGLIVHKLRSSRPPDVPFIHRYYIDLALLIIGGVLFWEFQSRGQFVSGGLFKDIQVNEILLIAPVLFLLVVALIFMRLFPLLVRFVSGESSTLVHLVAAAALLALAPLEAARQLDQADAPQAGVAVAILAAVAAFYWAARRSTRPRSRLVFVVLQAAAVAAFIAFSPLDSDELTFLPSLALLAIVPLQVAFLAAKLIARTAPVWLSMSLWRMARNPLQYTWLIVLLLLATGLAVLSTTVGGSLDKSQQDRILYDIAADVRISDVHPSTAGSAESLRSTFQDVPGVNSLALGLRQRAMIGPARPVLLGLESQEFRYVSWYRDDFSSRSFASVMSALRMQLQDEPILIPDGATMLAMWIKPQEAYPGVLLQAVVEDARGVPRVLRFGGLGPPEWHTVQVNLEPNLPQPLRLLSVQIVEAGTGAVGTPGSILIDDILAAVGPENEIRYLEDFEARERPMNWVAIATASFSTDRLVPVSGDVVRGGRAGRFIFGKELERGIRGFYQSPTGGPIPTVVSETFLDTMGYRVGERFVANLGFAQVPLVIRDSVDYFPTLSPEGPGFLLIDLDNLVDHMKVLSPAMTVVPNEVFISEAPTAGRSVTQVAEVLTRPFARVSDLETSLTSARTDPLTSAGWRATMVLSLGVVLLAAGLGYLTFVLSVAGKARSELGFLRSMGFSRAQISWLMGFEHLAIGILGLGLGTWVGLRASQLLVSSVSVTDNGDRMVPPFVLQTEWTMALPVYVGVIGLFIVAVFFVNRTLPRLDLQLISRTEGL